MSKTAFIFSGQGDQYPGMGKKLYDRYPAAREVFDMCDGIRPGTKDECFYGSEEELKVTENTQPDLFALEYAYASVLMDKGVRPDALAGFSLGEVTAAAVSGMFTVDKAFELVCRRGQLMQHEAGKHDTFMAAIIKLGEEELVEICKGYDDIFPVNFNCPGQITVSGLSCRLEEFSEAVRAAGGRVRPLKVSGAFHSPFMKPASDTFREEIIKAGTSQPDIVLYSDVTARPYSGDYADLLSRQICSPVMWEKIIRNMIAEGVTTFIEIGPGKTLTNMTKRIDPAVKAITAEAYLDSLEPSDENRNNLEDKEC